MWRDESVTYQVAHRSGAQILRLLQHVDTVHGLYYLLMHQVFGLWDGGLAALRAPSVVAFALTAGLVGATTRRLAGARAGLLAGLAFAGTPICLKYAQEGRSYALVCAAVALSLYCLVRMIEDERRRWSIGYAAALVVACWLNEFAILVLAANALTVFRGGCPDRVRRRWIESAVVVVALVAPLLVVSERQAGQQLHWLGRPGLWNWALFLVLAGVVVLLCRYLRVGGPGHRPPIMISAPLFVAPSLLLLLVSEAKPLYVDRYVLYSYLGLAVLLGCAADRALSALGRRRRSVRAVVVLCVVAAALGALVPWWVRTSAPGSRKDDVFALERAAAGLARPGDGVLFLPARRREWLLSFPRTLARLDDLALAQSPVASATLEGTNVSPPVLLRRAARVSRIIVFEDRVADRRPDHSAVAQASARLLREDFRATTVLKRHGGQVVLYVRVRPAHRG